MSTRKRQRPSARDFFDYQPPPTKAPPPQPSALILDFQKPQPNPNHFKNYYSDLIQLDPFHQILELIRGRNKIDSLDSFSEQPFAFILKSQDTFHRFPNPIHDFLEPSHIARLLWGPGKREIAHGKTIFLGPLRLSVDEGRTLTTQEVYAIGFSDQRSADLGAQIIEYRLNQFFLSQDQKFLVQVKDGSSRWFVKDQNKSLDQFGWNIEKKKIPYLRPLPTLKTHPTDNTQDNNQSFTRNKINDSSSFEISQLPKLMTIPTLMQNLLKLEWLEFPIQIKLTEETTTDLPIRILLKFSNPIPAKICKLSLFHHCLNLKPDQKNNEKTKIVQFIIDEGDSSIEDTWNIWKTASVWDQQAIGHFIKSHESNKRKIQEEEDDKVDQLEEDKPDGFGSDEFDEWASSHPIAEGAPEETTTRTSRTRQTSSFQQQLDKNEQDWEIELERLTLLADEEYLNNRNAAKVPISNPNSGFYQVSQRVLEDKQFNNLMNLIKTKSRRRKLTKEYRKIKPLSKKIKRQRRVWRRGGGEEEEGNVDSDSLETEEEAEPEPESDQPDQHQHARFNEQDWKKFRLKTRSKRLLDPPSSEDDNDDEIVSKSLLTHVQVYQHKFARPAESVPGDVN